MTAPELGRKVITIEEYSALNELDGFLYYLSTLPGTNRVPEWLTALRGLREAHRQWLNS